MKFLSNFTNQGLFRNLILLAFFMVYPKFNVCIFYIKFFINYIYYMNHIFLEDIKFGKGKKKKG